jgi:NADH dehydrogenase [ubiquinone] 1 alpha subcomplex assembly factor 7
MFGEMLGAWVADTWDRLGQPNPFVLMECGPGRGTLMADMMRVLEKLPSCHDAAQVQLIEMSPILTQKQKENISFRNIEWFNSLEQAAFHLPQNTPVILIANEFLDALPMQQFVFSDTRWLERKIEIGKNDTLQLALSQAPENIEKLLEHGLFPPEEGSCFEISFAQKDYIADIANILKKQRGSALFIDYGFSGHRYADSVQAVRAHTPVHILDKPGESDLTAHVNFSLIERWGLEQNMVVSGPVAQGRFLTRLGIETRAETLSRSATPEQKRDIYAALDRLTGMGDNRTQMGALFKVMALSLDPTLSLAGF